MEVVNRIEDNGSIVGYTIKDDDFVLPMCKKAMYLEPYVQGLMEVGYIYRNYNADEIENKSGEPISSLPPIQLGEVDELEWYASIEHAATEALSDVDMCKYYQVKSSQEVIFKKEDTYEINTRAEFISYLERLRQSFYNSNYSSDNRPINSFVNPEALFTIKEINESAEIKDYLKIIIKRHCFRDYEAYKSLIDFLMEKGVLKTSTPNQAEFLNAYYAWGVEGIKDKCVKVETKLNVDGVFKFVQDPLGGGTSPMSYIISNRYKAGAVLDCYNKIHFLKLVQDLNIITDAKDFGRNRIAVTDNNNLSTIKRLDNFGSKYHLLSNVSVSDVTDRLYITLVSDNGYSYIFKVAVNKIKLSLATVTTDKSLFSFDNNFEFNTIANINVPYQYIDNELDLSMWNMALTKSAQLLSRKTYPTPVNSTSEFLSNDGVNPLGIIDYIANSISHRLEFKSNKRFTMNDTSENLCDALKLYLKPIPDYILQSFNLTNEDLEDGIVSFIELADVDDLNDRREAMMQQKLVPGEQGFDYTYRDYQTKFAKQEAQLEQLSSLLGRQEKKIDAVDYYTKIKFVHDCLHGNLTINNFGDGIFEDIGANLMTSAQCMLSAVYAEYGDRITGEEAYNVILKMEDTDLIKVDNIFKDRDNALKGYMVDFGEYRYNRACDNTKIWAYCTKVFREISNAPIEKQRPYLMELVVLETTKEDMTIRNLINYCIEEAITNANLSKTTWWGLDDWSEYKCAMSSKYFIGAKLFFDILAGRLNNTEPVDGIYEIPVKIYDEKEIVIKLPVDVYAFIKSFNINGHKKYITVCDYCKYEYDPNTKNGIFNFCLINASVDPWHVKPKRGYSIKTYPLIPNYYLPDVLDKANGAGFYQKGLDCKAICAQPFIKLYGTKAFTPEVDADEMYAASEEIKSITDVNMFMDTLRNHIIEYISAYVKRWSLTRKVAKERGQKLISIPLKQDIVYESLAYLYCDEVPSTSPVFINDSSFNDLDANSNLSIGVISWKDFEKDTVNMLTNQQKRLIPFSVYAIKDCDASVVKDILNSERNMPLIVTGNYINLISDNTRTHIAVSRLTEAEINKFKDNKLIIEIGDGKYFIRALNGDYIMEV